MDILAIGVAGSGGGGGGTPTDAYSKTETDALLKNKVGFAEYKDNKISLYDSSSKDKIIGEIDLPVDMVVDQIKTKFSQKFKFDSTTYPDTENPNLDGKPVLVLAIKTSATADTFSFLNMESLVDVYTGGTTKSAIISVDPETGVITNVVRISAETGNKIVQKDDGLFVPNQTAVDVSYSNTTSKLKATTTQAAIDETLGVANSKYSKPETGIPSTDMTQAVKDSLGKADTALQAADKTDLQEKINAKLDKTAVLSDFSSSELTNKVPSAQLVLDTFTKKTTIVESENNTRIVTVPSDIVGDFAAVSMIGGKTVKDGDVLKSAPVEKVISRGTNMVSLDDFGAVTGNPGRYGFEIKNAHAGKYTIIVANKGTSYSYIGYNHNGTVTNPSGYAIKGSEGRFVVTVSEGDSVMVWHDANITTNSVVSKIMIVAGEVDEYIPYNKTELSLAELAEKLPDYGKSAGNAYNYIDNERGVYMHCVKGYKFSDLNIEYRTADQYVGANYFRSPIPKIAKSYLNNAICATYERISDRANLAIENNKFAPWNSNGDMVAFSDSSCTSLQSFLDKNINNEFIYELAQPEEIPLSSLISPLVVEPGGTIEFANEHNLDVPNKVIYKKEV